MIIAFSGSKGVGKDTASEPLQREGFTKASFSAIVKEICSKVFHIPYATLDDPDKKDLKFDNPIQVDLKHIQTLNQELDEYQFISNEIATKIGKKLLNKVFYSPREILQFVGTDVVRNLVDDDFWIKAFKIRLEWSSKFNKNFVVTDARFPNERACLRAMDAILLKVERPGWDKSDHISDNLLGSDSEYHLVLVNDGTIQQLHDRMMTAYAQISRSVFGTTL